MFSWFQGNEIIQRMQSELLSFKSKVMCSAAKLVQSLGITLIALLQKTVKNPDFITVIHSRNTLLQS